MNEKKISLLPLIALSIGSMVGAGVFGLPGDMAADASAGAILIGWLITGVGIIMLALVFQMLAFKKTNIVGGVYGYARTGFGEFPGFVIGWGYYLSAVIANIAFYIGICDAIGYFIPVFKDTTNPITIISISALLWLYNSLILKGIRDAAFVNLLVTFCKLIPIIVFILVAAVLFKVKHFSFDFWGQSMDLGNVTTQVKNTMLITLWAFVGVEGVSVLSSRAKKMSDVGRATIIGLLTTLVMYALVSLLSLGAMEHAKLAGFENPSMAYALEHMIGKSGAILVNAGLIISILGALLGWTMIAAEIPYQAGKDGLFPKFTIKENKNGSPIGAVMLTSIISQFMILIAAFVNSTYQALYILASAAIIVPYLSSAAYGLKLTLTENNIFKTSKEKTTTFAVVLLSIAYSIWLLIATGKDLLLAVTILYTVGIAVYIFTKIEHKQKIFKVTDIILAAFLLLVTVYAIYYIADYGVMKFISDNS